MLITLLILARANGPGRVHAYAYIHGYEYSGLKKMIGCFKIYICNLIIHNIVSYNISYKLKRRFRSNFLEIDFSLLPRWKASDNSPSETLLNYRFSPGGKRTPFSDQKGVEKKCVLKSCHENKGPNPACLKPYGKKKDKITNI